MRTHGSIALGITLIVALSSCAATLRHSWSNSEFGIDVQSDFSRLQTEAFVTRELSDRIRAYRPLFGVDKLDSLRLFVHDRRAPALGSGSIRGFHRKGEIHVFARFANSVIEIPHPDAKSTAIHELVHGFVDLAGWKIPLWMEEGLAEVIAHSPVDESRRIEIWFAIDREQETQSVRRRGESLSGDELFAIREQYPAVEKLRAMYAQSASFVAFLLQRDGFGALEAAELRRRIDRMLHASDEELRERYREWEREIASSGVTVRLTRGIADGDVRFRRRAASALMHLEDKDEAYWQLATGLLSDHDEGVRSSAQIGPLTLPKKADRPRFEAWRRAGFRPLRLAGLVGLAGLGDRAAAVEFFEAMRLGDATEWTRAALQLVLRFRPPDGDELQRALLTSMAKPQNFPALCSRIAARLSANR